MAVRKYTPVETTVECKSCGKSFSYMRIAGSPRRHCSSKCRNRHRADLKALREKGLPPCTVEGCAGKGTRIRFGVCEKHYYRLRRTGLLVKPHPEPRVDSGGYVSVKIVGHPLSSDGWLREHRAIAYSKYAGVCPPCHWCGRAISWSGCHVDHVNGVKTDNHPDNLVVACPQCNRMRGASWPFLMGLTEAGLAHLLAQLAKERASVTDQDGLEIAA